MFAFTFKCLSSVISFAICIFRVEPARTDEESPLLSFTVCNMKENKPYIRNKECQYNFLSVLFSLLHHPVSHYMQQIS